MCLNEMERFFYKEIWIVWTIGYSELGHFQWQTNNAHIFLLHSWPMYMDNGIIAIIDPIKAIKRVYHSKETMVLEHLLCHFLRRNSMKRPGTIWPQSNCHNIFSFIIFIVITQFLLLLIQSVIFRLYAECAAKNLNCSGCSGRCIEKYCTLFSWMIF